MQVLLDVVRGGEGTGRLNGREDQVEVAFCVSEVGGLVLTCMLNYCMSAMSMGCTHECGVL